MADIWRPQTIEIYKYWTGAIREEASDKLSIWEINFVVTIESRLAQNKQLTENQATVLERIYAEYTS